jgi:purine-binding chemotaxis protein CheW
MSETSAIQPAAQPGKYLTFFLDSEEYGIEILKVQEIIGRMAITPVPGTPQSIRGVINLRGKIIPVMDLKIKFGMNITDMTDLTCIIVLRTEHLMMGILVDRVMEVSTIGASDLESIPSFGVEVDTSFLLGIGKVAGRVKLLLNIDHVLTTQEIIDLTSIKTITGDPAPV